MPVVELSISGNDKQEKRSGSNILNFNVSQNSKVTVNNDGTITINGTGGFSLNFEQITLKSGVTYYEKFELISGSITGSNFFLSFNGTTWLSKNNFINYTPTEDTNKSSLWIHQDAVFENAVIKLWANTDQSDFEQYGAMPSPEYPSEVETVNTQANIIICNKNFLKLDDIEETTINGITYSIKNGIVKLTGTATNGVDITLKRNIKLKSNTYTHSVNTILQGMYLCFDNISNSSLSYEAGTEKHFKIETETTYNRYILWINNGTTLDLELKIQLETGEIKTDFVVPEQQTKTVDIQQEMLEGDYFVKEEDGWKEVHLWNKLIFTGQENWLKSGDSTDEILGAAYEIGNGVMGYGYSNYFIYNINIKNGYFSVYNKGLHIRFFVNTSVILDINSFKTWLAQKYTEGNPVYVWYKLATPTKLVCTETQSAQLDDLLNTSTYKNVTHIYSTDKVSPIIKIKYKKDLETMLNSQKNDYDTRLSNIEKLLSTTTTSALLLDNLQTDLEKEVL